MPCCQGIYNDNRCLSNSYNCAATDCALKQKISCTQEVIQVQKKLKSFIIIVSIFRVEREKEHKQEGWDCGKGERSGEKLQSAQVLRQLNQLSGSQAEQSGAHLGRKAPLFVTMRASTGSVLLHTAEPWQHILSCESHVRFSDSSLSFSHTASLCARTYPVPWLAPSEINDNLIVCQACSERLICHQF